MTGKNYWNFLQLPSHTSAYYVNGQQMRDWETCLPKIDMNNDYHWQNTNDFLFEF